MTHGSERAAEWIYGGIWRFVVAWFRVPREAPSLPEHEPGTLRQIHPALGFLRYLKLMFWIALVVVDGAILIAWLGIAVASPSAGALWLAPALALAVLPDIVVDIALHLRYDTTWYVMSSRSLRIRCGIWVLREMTITFENVQNIRITQGPVMRWFGIKNLVVETAGAAGQSAEGGGAASNQAVLEGIDNADEIRDLILARARASRSAGLGDEAAEPGPVRAPASAGAGWTSAQIGFLREIRDEAARLAR